MKKIILIITLVGLCFGMYAQHNYDYQNTIYSNNGNVGIGIMYPGSKLTVAGDINIGGNSGSAGLITRHINGKDYSSNTIGDLHLNYNTGKHVLVGFGGQNSNMFVSGNIGVGTTSPTSKLTVIGDINIGGNNGNASLITRHINGKDYYSNTVGDLHLNYNTGKHVLVGFGGQSSNMLVSGNVGIGTTTTGSHKLAVDGSIGAREVLVEAGTWSDFVFEEAYNLPTLDEVEKHIEEKGHLKDIPSAKEVEANGICLGEMDAKLLQKIEELMLYTIQQQKEITKLQKENKIPKALLGRITELEKQLQKEK